MKRISRFIFFILAMVSFKTEIYSQQNKISGVIFSSSSNEALTSLQQGMKFYDLNENKKAHEYFEKAIQQDPKLTMGYLLLADQANSPGEFVKYLDQAKENLANASEWEKMYYAYNETFLSDDLNKRIDAAQKIVTKFPDVPRSYLMLGNAYGETNDFAHARLNYQKAIATDPKWTAGYYALSNSFLFQDPKNFKQAEANATKLTELAPESPGSFILLGDTYRAQNNMQKAYEAYSKAVMLDPESPTALYKRGHAETFLGEYEKARADYQQAGSLDVSPGFAIQVISFTYLYQDQPDKALQVLLDEAQRTGEIKDANRDVVDKFQLLTTAAQIAFHTGDANKLESIVNMLEPVSESMGNSIGTNEGKINQKSNMLYWRGMIKTLNRDLMNAMAKATEMKNMLEPIQNPRKLEGYEELLGHISYYQKNYKDAAEHFAKTNPLDIYDRYWLGRSYEAAGKKDKAKAIYNEIANYNFNNIGFALVRNDIKKRL
ncbi:MAG TPA: tetratricopeptide repeat protein [Flavisolibacter sp.]|nr:tetratricopeptide repeat protein [Flavisolibacter sp.]